MFGCSKELSKMGTIKDRNGKDLTKAKEIKKRLQESTNYTKKVLMARITMLVWSVTQSQTFLSVTSSEPSQALLLVKLVEVMEFQQSCLKS